MTAALRWARTAALVTIASSIFTAAIWSFAESYRGLFVWASRHGLGGWWAFGWPLMVDVFIAVGELALFVAVVDRWRRRDRVGAWVVTGAGLVVSVAGNVGHAAGGSVAARVTAAVPPVAAAAALAVGLGVLKRVIAVTLPAIPGAGVAVPAAAPVAANGHDPALAVFADDLAAGKVPGIPRIKEVLRCGQPRAQQVRDRLRVLAGQD